MRIPVIFEGETKFMTITEIIDVYGDIIGEKGVENLEALRAEEVFKELNPEE